MTLDDAKSRIGRVAAVFRGLEGGVLVAAFLISMVLALIDAVARPLGGVSVPGSASYRAPLTAWLAFLGGLLAARRRHLTLSTAERSAKQTSAMPRLFSSSVAAVCACSPIRRTASSTPIDSRDDARDRAPDLGDECIMPVALALISVRLAWGASRAGGAPSIRRRGGGVRVWACGGGR
jgi:hypothetical protein